MPLVWEAVGSPYFKTDGTKVLRMFRISELQIHKEYMRKTDKSILKPIRGSFMNKIDKTDTLTKILPI